MGQSVIEAELRSLLEKVSNNGEVALSEEAIEAFGEQAKEAVRKQFTPRDTTFRPRASNIGRPLCVLQRQKEGAEEEPMPYNHVIRMLIGDCVEAIVRLLLTAAGSNVTSDGDKVELDIDGTAVKGESDIDIGGKVYDIKSCSPFAFMKWQRGYEALAAEDDFGYIGQLFFYADAQKKQPGGWIVVNKSSGEITVVDVEGGRKEAKRVRDERSSIISALANDAPFRRCFEAEDEFFRKKKTGDKVLSKACGFCGFKKHCWPTAKYRPSRMSNPEAKAPTYRWFTD